MRVRLIRKLADCVDGVDLSKRRVGQVLDLPESDAQLLIAEEWAQPVRRRSETRSLSFAQPSSMAADRSRGDSPVERIRAAGEELGHRHLARPSSSRRAEDRQIELLRDERERSLPND